MNKTSEKQSVVKIQAIIIAFAFAFIVIGTTVLFMINYQNTYKSILNRFSEQFMQKSIALDNSIEQVVDHVSRMHIVANDYLTSVSDFSFLKQELNKLEQISSYNENKDFHQFHIGMKFYNQPITSTISAHGQLAGQGCDYLKQLVMVLTLQPTFRSYQETHSNVVLSYYVSKKSVFAGIYPPIPILKVIGSKTHENWINSAYEVYHDGVSPTMNPKREVFWTVPYVDRAGNGLMVTCAIPVDVDREPIGVLGDDVVLGFLHSHTRSHKILPGILAIATATGDIISATDTVYTKESDLIKIGNILPLKQVSGSVQESTVRLQEFEKHFLFSIKLKNAPWYYYLSIEKEQIASQVFKQFGGIIYGFILFLIMIPLILLYIYKRIIKPGIHAEQKIYQLNMELDQKVIERTFELQASERYNKTLFEDSRLPLVIMDGGTNQFLDCNQAAVDIYGFSEKTDLLGKTPLDVSADPQYDDQDAATLATKHISNALHKGVVVFDWKHKRPSGEFWDAEVQLMSIELDKKTCLQFSLLDITERKIAREKQLKLESQLSQSQKMDAVGQLAGGIAHDFNNMLGAIMGFSELLLLPKFDLSDKAKSHVHMILKSAKRAADLTAQILTFSRKNNVELTLVDLHKILDDTHIIFSKTIDKQIKIFINKGAEHCNVTGDPAGLQNMLLNIGINASHAMPDGGTLHITTKNISLNEKYCEISPFSIVPGKYLEIEIRDNGTGISIENQKKIFEPFFTTKAQGEGTGLGLSTVYGLVQAYRGCVTVYSEEGEGTAFHVMLPLNLDHDIPEKASEQIITGSGTVLFVDDEELIRLSGESIFNELGYHVILANNGQEAVDQFIKNKNKIDLVVLDMIMPEMNGTETFYKLREIDAHCKIIVASGFTKDENLKELYKHGLIGFVKKPFRITEISRQIANALQSVPKT